VLKFVDFASTKVEFSDSMRNRTDGLGNGCFMVVFWFFPAPFRDFRSVSEATKGKKVAQTNATVLKEQRKKSGPNVIIVTQTSLVICNVFGLRIYETSAPLGIRNSRPNQKKLKFAE